MSWLGEAYKLFQAMKRPLSHRDISVRTSLSEETARQCISRLKRAGCIRFVSGSARTGRLYELVPGVPAPEDGRGKHPNSWKHNNIARFNEQRRKTSAPISQFTAAKPKAA